MLMSQTLRLRYQGYNNINIIQNIFNLLTIILFSKKHTSNNIMIPDNFITTTFF